MDKDDVDYYVDDYVIYGTENGLPISELIRQVMLKLPYDFEPPNFIYIADVSTALPLNLPHRYQPTRTQPQICNPSNLWVVILDGKIAKESDSYVRGVIAHELAHYTLKHNSPARVTKGNKEAEADALARKWGFDAEISEIRNANEIIQSKRNRSHE